MDRIFQTESKSTGRKMQCNCNSLSSYDASNVNLVAFGLTDREHARIIFTVGQVLTPLILLGSLAVWLLQTSAARCSLVVLTGVSCLALPAMFSLGLQISYYVLSLLWLGWNIHVCVVNSCFVSVALPLFLTLVISLYILHGIVIIFQKLRS